MRIYSMTATFGKLEHETLTLQPGLNVIHAPNEWGKSTWCAFLAAMLYGLDTRAHSTKTALADKEHYAPWSGSPMAGRMDLCWNGRDITIERRTKGRSNFGDFKAYETRTGLPVPELTAANCGLVLLGVEKSVFTRSAFLRLTDLPVTQDEALRHRLNALVTTGDESGTAEKLERKLRELKNRCRYNRTGLLPQAEAEAAALEEKLRELDSLDVQSKALSQRRTEVENYAAQLDNHRQALAYQAAQADRRRVEAARATAAQAAEALARQEARCAGLPTREEAAAEIRALQDLQARWNDVQSRLSLLTAPVPAADAPAPFRGLKAAEAQEKARQDAARYGSLRKIRPLLLIPGLLALSGGMAGWLLAPEYAIYAWAAMGVGAMFAAVWGITSLLRRHEANTIAKEYGSGDPAQGMDLADCYVNQVAVQSRSLVEYEAAREELNNEMTALRRETAGRCGDQSLSQRLGFWQQAAAQWDALDAARREYRQRQQNAEAMAAMVKTAPPPQMPDALTLSEGETARQADEAAQELRRLHDRLGQCRGRMEAIGQRSTLEGQLNAIHQRIGQLEETYAALGMALTTLEKARAELQRRFAPKITQRAQALLTRLTRGRYDRLVLGADLSLHATAHSEDTLRSALWRSDGTVDQLYLALRLAVAEELAPDAPLVLDDALVRFDDDRLKAAMDVLKEEAAARQVLLFTCQQRELQLS